MLWLVLIAAGLTPSKAVQKLTTDRIIMRQAKRFPGLPNCHRNTIFLRPNTAGVLCRLPMPRTAAHPSTLWGHGAAMGASDHHSGTRSDILRACPISFRRGETLS